MIEKSVKATVVADNARAANDLVVEPRRRILAAGAGG